MPTRKATAEWNGSVKQGSGTIGVESGTLSGADYSFQGRFEGGDGTNPDELLGAAHAGCYSMALSLALGDNGHEPESIETTAKVTIDEVDGDPEITGIELVTSAKVPDISDEDFQSVANAAKDGCPLSKALKAVDISLDATLES
ncbi:MAG: OsmC family protein [Solirubrobacterales bacterium]